MRHIFLIVTLFLILIGCSKSSDPTADRSTFSLTRFAIDEKEGNIFKGIAIKPKITLIFDKAVDKKNIEQNVELFYNGTKYGLDFNFSSDNKTVTIFPKVNLSPLSSYHLVIRSTLIAQSGERLDSEKDYTFTTAIDSTDKFPRISTEELLTKVQRQTFSYFWDFAHPASGMIRERNTSGDVVTTGGSGFGVMAIISAAERGFITKSQGMERVKKIVSFLKSADRYHGAFSHWYNGNTGKTVPFSQKDDGADLVETALLFQGLLAARNYFNDIALSEDITALYNAVEWSFFRNNQKGLFWHWSPTYAWDMNLKVKGWNEALILYVLAAGSPTFPIDKEDYEEGWANNGGIQNGSLYYGITLPLGPERGGPLFISQYSFLGLNPHGLKDKYADYELQVRSHTLINRAYCIANPHNFYGYSAQCWGLTASDSYDGYSAHSPTNDRGVISPTAALSSMPYTPEESLDALEFMYYKLGDRIWGEYGFKDAFSLDKLWFADSYLAIDQGPIIIGIENYRSGLLWSLFMQCPEVKNGLTKLDFTSPNI
ncbi:glucoamylase family protein [Sphingobacterium thermophilum]|uniref:Glucoamylase family protein n=1 Tax=Sphingobacterium thermophilum TaxID=768534 RepID=A0ABP8QXC0_9SPHI